MTNVAQKQESKRNSDAPVELQNVYLINSSF